MQRRFRLRSKREFQQVYDRGRSVANRVAVLYAVRLGPGVSRVGFAAGRKLGGAVARNRAKRRIREAVRLLWPQVKDGWGAIFIARAAALDMPFAELQRQVRELLVRAGLLRGAGAEGRT